MFVLKSVFFDSSTWGAITPHSLHLPRQTKLFWLSQSKAFEQRREMTFDCRLPNITELVFGEITANSQG